MKNKDFTYILKALGLSVLFVFVALAIGVGIHEANAEYNPRAVLRVNSSFTGSDAVVGLHTPIVSTVPGASAAFTTSLFTSSTAATNFTTAASITTAFDLIEVRVNLSAASSTQTLILSIDSGAGTEFDVPLDSTAMTLAWRVFRPTRPVPFRSTDALRVVYPNASSDTIGTEIVYVTTP